ncbi:hypothetical protein CBR_g45617 [Chara braunii]|uniref:Uncharacterized protein n=1 Tax=Chara braunii TaxID=69332 RepID=A0A388LZC5_CHABU|nr:hypothetical protein CBR_g45617 [Chara braunii]|eukprot:GBG87559.1 hypothetical protein CBR_g45617 [Chara braunii]
MGATNCHGKQGDRLRDLADWLMDNLQIKFQGRSDDFWDNTYLALIPLLENSESLQLVHANGLPQGVKWSDTCQKLLTIVLEHFRPQGDVDTQQERKDNGPPTNENGQSHPLKEETEMVGKEETQEGAKEKAQKDRTGQREAAKDKAGPAGGKAKEDKEEDKMPGEKKEVSQRREGGTDNRIDDRKPEEAVKEKVSQDTGAGVGSKTEGGIKEGTENGIATGKEDDPHKIERRNKENTPAIEGSRVSEREEEGLCLALAAWQPEANTQRKPDATRNTATPQPPPPSQSTDSDLTSKRLKLRHLLDKGGTVPPVEKGLNIIPVRRREDSWEVGLSSPPDATHGEITMKGQSSFLLSLTA